MKIPYDLVGESRNLKFIPATVEESVGGHRILGKVEGQHFHPNGLSRNKRYYPEALWQRTVHKDENVKRKLENRTMFGTIGHDTEITERELREGIPSHITTYMCMNENGIPGFARTEILDTRTGQTLKAYLEAGVNLYVSSRADGEYVPNQFFTTHEGKFPIMKADTYKLERFDFVLEPGFLTANPKLQESIYESLTPEALVVHQHFLEADQNYGVQDQSPDVKDINDEPQEGDSMAQTSNPDLVSDGTTDYPKDADDLLYSPPTGEYNTSSSKVGTNVIQGMPDSDTEGGQNILGNDMLSVTSLGASVSPRDDATQGGINSPANDSDGSRNTVSNDTNQNVNSQSKQAKKDKSMTLKKESVDEVSQLDILLSENEALRIENEATVAKLAEAEEAIAYALKAQEFFNAVGKPTQIVERLQAAIEFHQRVGTYEQIESVIETFSDFIEEAGNPSEVKEALEATIAFNEQYSPESIATLIEEVGTAEEIMTALESTTEFFEQAGATGPELLERLQTLRSFEQQFGEVWAVGSKLERVAILDKEVSARRISEDCSIDYEKAMEKLNSGLNESQIREFYTALNTGLTDIAVFAPRSASIVTGKMTESVKPIVATSGGSAVRRVLEGLN